MRSWILVPADNDKALETVAGSGADAVVVDLASSVRTRDRLQVTLQGRDWLASHREQVLAARKFERWARIPALDSAHWREALDVAMEGTPNGIVLAGCRGADDIRQLASVLYEIEDRHGLAANSTRILPELAPTPQSALALARLVDEMHPRVAALTWDAAGLARTMGARRLRGPGGRWSDPLAHVRAQILLIAHARELQAIEHPFHDIRDGDAGRQVAEAARADGFTGMFALHPSQIAAINAAFSPTEAELAEARQIVAAFATDPHAEVVAVGKRSADRADLIRARRLLGED